ncbi:hypothetical protein T484DRAFT_3641428 [Baffinella frigidus]|nr:hypothetical protein T484DRAFT_3641428 [Cryptophyta sp. CCMP2293]
MAEMTVISASLEKKKAFPGTRIPPFRNSSPEHMEQQPEPKRPDTQGTFMQLTAHVSPSAARIPRLPSLAPSQELKSLLVARSSMDELLLFALQRAAPSQALMFPVQYHAVGECLAHPHRPCKCVKTRRMAQSQADAWLELGKRFKERYPKATPDTPTGCARPARRSSCFEVRDRTEVAGSPAFTRVSSAPQKSCPVGSPVRRTASTPTPAAAFRPSSAQPAPQQTLLLRQQTLRLRMRELEHARAHRAMEARAMVEARARGKTLPKLAGPRRVRDRVDDASG